MDNLDSYQLISIMQKTDTIYLDQKWMNPVNLSPQFISCSLCSKIPIAQQNQIECSSCNRLFCIQDYKSQVYQYDCCPICANSPWVANQQRHIAYKSAFQNATFVCQDCPRCQQSDQKQQQKIYNYKKFANHLQVHQGEINSQTRSNKKQKQLFKYELIDSTGANYALGNSEQVAINYCQHVNGNFCYFIGSDDKPLVIDLKNQEGYFDQKAQKMKLLKHKNDIIKNSTQYTLWICQKDKKRIYFDHYWQEKLLQAWIDYQSNNRLNEMHVEKQNIFLRINFKTLQIIVPSTEEIFKLQTQKIRFK